MKVMLVSCALLMAGLPIACQTTKPPQPKTKIEAFEAKTGTVIVSGFTETGAIPGELGGQVAVQATELEDASSGMKVFGVKIDVQKGDSIGTENASFLDADEIDSLLKGIDYISKLDASVTKMKSFQADYRTKDDLTISTFSQSDGKIETAITSGEIEAASIFLSPEGLAKFRALIVEAQTQINAAR